MNQAPHLNHEKKLWQKGFLVIGVDEVGRGALAGPVMAAACVFSPNIEKRLKNADVVINDSKKLTTRQREIAYLWIVKHCLFYSTGKAYIKQINKQGINKANLSAMRQAVNNLKRYFLRRSVKPPRLFVLSDYYFISYLRGIGQKTIVFGDTISLTIAAASIIAKVERDKLMVKLAEDYPVYHWNKNKGYGVSEHRKAIKKYGITKHHRTYFVRNILKT